MKMLKVLLFMLLATISLMLGCGGGSGSGGSQANRAQDMHGGKITISGNNQVVEFDLSAGVIRGVIHSADIHPGDVASVNFNSDRVGWKENSATWVKFDLSGKVTIPNTANNDIGTWTLKLKSGEFCWFNIDRWDYLGKPWYKIANNNISYGGYVSATIEFAAGKATINFGSNILAGLVIGPADPTRVVRVQWNSNRVGWDGQSTAYANLQMDAGGAYFAVIAVPSNDKGNFSILLTNSRGGDLWWFNIDMWKYSTNVVLDHSAGQIEYNML